MEGRGVEDRVTSGERSIFILVCPAKFEFRRLVSQGSVSAEKLQFRNIRAGHFLEAPKSC